MTLVVASNEARIIRIFHIDRSEDALQTMVAPLTDETLASRSNPRPRSDAARSLLGSDVVVGTACELFPVDNLEGIGLSAYLTQGHGVAETEVASNAELLDGLKGYVLIVFSNAFRGRETTISPAEGVTLIGTYQQLGTDWAATPQTPAESARPFSTPPEAVKKKPSDAAMSGRVATLALLVLFGLVGLMVWIGR